MAMACRDMGRFVNAKNILSQYARFLLKEEEAAKIVNDMVNQVRATWYNTARACGVSENDAEAIRGAFLYEGFFSCANGPKSLNPLSRFLSKGDLKQWLDTRGMLASDWIVVHVICWPTLSIGATDEV